IIPQTVDYEAGELIYPAAGTMFIASKIQCCTLSALDLPASGALAISTNTGATFSIGDVNLPMFGLARNSAGVVLVVGQNGRIHRRPGPFNGPIPIVAGPPPAQNYDPSNSLGSSSFLNSQVGVVVQESDNLSYQFSGNTTYFAVTHDGGQSW